MQALMGGLISACTTSIDQGVDRPVSDSGGIDVGARDTADADVAGEDRSMQGTLYEPGRKFGQTYCGPCHSLGGRHPKQPSAYQTFRMDTYEGWSFSRTILLAVLDKWNPDGKVMPPPEAYVLPPDDVLRTILDWVRRGSPNTVDGK